MMPQRSNIGSMVGIPIGEGVAIPVIRTTKM